MNKVLKINNKEAYRDQWNHRTKPCLLLGGGCSNTGSDILYIKKMLVNSVGHSSNEKILQLYTILVAPWAGIYIFEAFESLKIHCPGDKNLCMGSQWLFFVNPISPGRFNTFSTWGAEI